MIAAPPRISMDGRIKHALLDDSLFHIRAEVLDVVFHTAVITIHDEFLPEMREVYSGRRLRGPPGSPAFLELHDRCHGQPRRSLLHLAVQYNDLFGLRGPR